MGGLPAVVSPGHWARPWCFLPAPHLPPLARWGRHCLAPVPVLHSDLTPGAGGFSIQSEVPHQDSGACSSDREGAPGIASQQLWGRPSAWGNLEHSGWGENSKGQESCVAAGSTHRAPHARTLWHRSRFPYRALPGEGSEIQGQILTTDNRVGWGQ